jgi:DNA-binding NtrC family response regulator
VENGKTIEGIHEKAYSRLCAYSWPGNIREVQNGMESAVVMCRKNLITDEDLPPALQSLTDDGWVSVPLDISLEEAEKLLVRAAVNYHKGNKSKAAEALGIGRKTLHRKLDDGEEDDSES